MRRLFQWATGERLALRALGHCVMAGAAALISFSASGLASGGGTTTSLPTYYEQGVLIRAGEAIQPLGPNLMGDAVNEYSGSLEFNQTDVSLPGNGTLSVAVGRRLATSTRQAALNSGLFGDWDIDIPHLHTVTTQIGTWYGNGWSTPNLNRCSQLQAPLGASVVAGSRTLHVSPYQYWDGYHLYIPGSGDQTMLGRFQTTGHVIWLILGGHYPNDYTIISIKN